MKPSASLVRHQNPSAKRILVASLAILALLPFASTAAAEDQRQPADLLPPSVVAFAEIKRPQELVATIYVHDLVHRFMALDDVRSAMEKKPYLDFKAAVAVVESQMGLPWRKIVGQASGRGIAVALDAKSQGVVVLARASDSATQSELLDVLTGLARIDATQKSKADPVTVGEYRGIKTYQIERIAFAVVNDWLVIANKFDLGKQIIDGVLDTPKESLAKDAQFLKARGNDKLAASAWAYVNTAALRDAGVAKQVLSGVAENPLVELFFGGILSTLKQTPYATISVDLSDRQLHLIASAPHDRSWAGESREYFFGPQGAGRAPPALVVDGAIVSSVAYRDVSAMWLRADDLFDKQTNEELAKADSGLTTLFAGKDFGQDILGAFRPESQVVVARQVFAEGQPAPAIKLPVFGVVAELKDPVKMQPELRRTFQSLIGFANIVGAMNGQPQLDLDMEKTEAGQFVTACYLPEADAKDPNTLKVNYNFSPSIAFAGNRFVVASTKAFAHVLATANAVNRPAGEGPCDVNSEIVMQFNSLREILADNRGQLVAQNMLNEGHSKAEAEKKISELLELVGWFDRLALALDTTPNELRLTLDVKLKDTH